MSCSSFCPAVLGGKTYTPWALSELPVGNKWVYVPPFSNDHVQTLILKDITALRSHIHNLFLAESALATGWSQTIYCSHFKASLFISHASAQIPLGIVSVAWMTHVLPTALAQCRNTFYIWHALSFSFLLSFLAKQIRLESKQKLLPVPCSILAFFSVSCC